MLATINYDEESVIKFNRIIESSGVTQQQSMNTIMVLQFFYLIETMFKQLQRLQGILDPRKFSAKGEGYPLWKYEFVLNLEAKELYFSYSLTKSTDNIDAVNF